MTEKTNNTEELIEIRVPKVSGAEAEEATELVEHLAEKYSITMEDTNALYNAAIAVYIREKMVYGERKPEICGSSACGPEGCN